MQLRFQFQQLQLLKISTIMKATPFLEELLHLAAKLLEKNGQQEIANQIYSIYKLPEWVQNNNPLLKKGLAKIIKEYVRNNKKMIKYYQTRAPIQEQEPEEESEEKPKKKKKSKQRHETIESPKVNLRSSIKTPEISPKSPAKVVSNSKSNWMAKFSEPKRLQQIHNLPKQKQLVEQQVPKKSSKSKKKIAEIVSSQYQSENDSFELEPKKKIKKEIKNQKVVEKQEKKEKKEKKVIQGKPLNEQKMQVEYKQQVKSYYNGPKKSFSRINPNEVGQIKQQLKDNSFQAKARYGQQADSWGQFGYDKLKDTRGESFKKTKGKLKNRAFQGALMDINKINSIPIL